MTKRMGGGTWNKERAAARQALRKKRARKRAVRTAVFLALAAALGAAAAFVILPQMNGEAADNAPQTEKRIATATLGTIEKTVFGSGEVQPPASPAYTLGRTARLQPTRLKSATA